MQLIAGKIYHIYNRGNRKENIFLKEDNYLFFLKKMRKELLPFADILAYCLMPNHFHWLLQVKSSDDSESSDDCATKLRNGVGVLLRSYTRAVQKQENFTGSLFQQKTKAVCVEGERQLLTCSNYIHQNPMKAGLVAKMEEWKYSSFSDYCNFRAGTLINKELLFDRIGIDPTTSFYNLSYTTLRNFELEKLF